MTYHPRIVDRELAERLAATGAVVIEGPRGLRQDDHGATESSGYGYTREDGVQVVPIGALGP